MTSLESGCDDQFGMQTKYCLISVRMYCTQFVHFKVLIETCVPLSQRGGGGRGADDQLCTHCPCHEWPPFTGLVWDFNLS